MSSSLLEARTNRPGTPFVVVIPPQKDRQIARPTKATIARATGDPTRYSIEVDQSIVTLYTPDKQIAGRRNYRLTAPNLERLGQHVTQDLKANDSDNPMLGDDYLIIKTSDPAIDLFETNIIGKSIYCDSRERSRLRRGLDAFKSWRGKPTPDMVRAYEIVGSDPNHEKKIREKTGFGLVVKPTKERTEIVIVDMKTGKQVSETPSTAVTFVTRKQNTLSTLAYVSALRGLTKDPNGIPVWLEPNTSS